MAQDGVASNVGPSPNPPSLFATQEQADEVDAPLRDAITRFVSSLQAGDEPSDEDWACIARRIFFLADDAATGHWNDSDSWSEKCKAAHSWVAANGADRLCSRAPKHETVDHMMDALKRLAPWNSEKARPATDSLADQLVRKGVTPLVLAVRALGGVGFKYNDVPILKRYFKDVVAWERRPDASVFEFCITRRCGGKYNDHITQLEDMLQGIEWNSYDVHPLATPQGASALLHREDATRVAIETARGIVTAHQDAARRHRRTEFPILFAAGAPGIGKSHFLDMLGNTIRSGLDGYFVVHVNLSFLNSTHWIPKETEVSMDSVLAARLLYAFVTSNTRREQQDYKKFVDAHPWVLQASSADVLKRAAKAKHGENAAKVVFAIGVDEVQVLVGGGERPERLTMLFQALGNTMQACVHPVVVVVAGVDRSAMEAAIGSSAHSRKHLELPWLTDDARMELFSGLSSSTLSVHNGRGAENWGTRCEAAKHLISEEHCAVALLQDLIGDTGGLPRLLVILAQSLVRTIADKELTRLADVNVESLRDEVAQTFATMRTNVANGGALIAVDKVKVLALVLGGIVVQRGQTVLDQHCQNTGAVKPRPASWLEMEGVVSCVGAQVNGTDSGAGGQDDRSTIAGAGRGAGAGARMRHCGVDADTEEWVVLTMPWLIVHAWVSSATRAFKSDPRLGGCLRKAYTNFLWCCRRWRDFELGRFTLFASAHAMWEAVGAVLYALRANAYLVYHQRITVDVKFKTFHRGALLTKALDKVSLSLHPCRVERVNEAFDGDALDLEKVTQYGSRGARTIPWKAEPSRHILLNGTNGQGVDIISLWAQTKPTTDQHGRCILLLDQRKCYAETTYLKGVPLVKKLGAVRAPNFRPFADPKPHATWAVVHNVLTKKGVSLTSVDDQPHRSSASGDGKKSTGATVDAACEVVFAVFATTDKLTPQCDMDSSEDLETWWKTQRAKAWKKCCEKLLPKEGVSVWNMLLADPTPTEEAIKKAVTDAELTATKILQQLPLWPSTPKVMWVGRKHLDVYYGPMFCERPLFLFSVNGNAHE